MYLIPDRFTVFLHRHFARGSVSDVRGLAGVDGYTIIEVPSASCVRDVLDEIAGFLPAGDPGTDSESGIFLGEHEIGFPIAPRRQALGGGHHPRRPSPHVGHHRGQRTFAAANSLLSEFIPARRRAERLRCRQPDGRRVGNHASRHRCLDHLVDSSGARSRFHRCDLGSTFRQCPGPPHVTFNADSHSLFCLPDRVPPFRQSEPPHPP